MTTTTTSASRADLVRWRMRALGLSGAPGRDSRHSSPRDSAAEAPVRAPEPGRAGRIVDRLFALQGQDWRASRWAIGVRDPGLVDADVRAAFDSGDLVRAWPMRGTLHVIRAADIGWVQRATNHRVLPGAAKRRAFLELDDETLARMTDVAVGALVGGRALSRDELAEAWVAAGIPLQSAWRYHVVWWLSQTGVIVLGPTDGAGGEPLAVLADEWIRAPRDLSGDAALAELARRYARGRGPVTPADFAWWTGLTMSESRRAFVAAASAEPGGDGAPLVHLLVEGTSYWADPMLLESGTTNDDDFSVPMLLPGFDEHLLGYRDRTAVLDPACFERVVPGRNGMFRGTAVRDGRVVGVWTRTDRARGTRITVEPFPDERLDPQEFAAAGEHWSHFHGIPAEISVAQ